jgi:feruloyl-CoA synthase
MSKQGAMRQTRVPVVRIDAVRAAEGIIHVTNREVLPDYPPRLTDLLLHWARAAPDRTFLAERDGTGGWRRMSYAETLTAVRRLGRALLDRGLSAERPLLVISGNGIDHALLGLAALYVGIPYCPVSPAYSLVSQDFGKLRYVLDLLTPGLVFARDGKVFGKAIAAALPADLELVVTDNPPDRPCTLFADLLAQPDTPAVAAANAQVGPDTIAKFLLTSGSTGMPKAVINTQRMLCSNQIMIREVLAFLQDAPPVTLDWLPWSHTFGGNHNVGLILYNGGTLYIDEGLPTPGGIAATVRNLREIAPNIYFNVPKGFEFLVPHLRADSDLRRNYFSRLECNFYAGASLSAHVWDALDELALAETGARVPMLTGLGSTETAPFALAATIEICRAGNIGVPAKGVALKLVPNNGKLEARVKGPNITPGYWRQPDLTAKNFDEEGFYHLGDAVRFADPDDIQKGFIFDGRLSEDFKLGSGTWVSVGPLRAAIIAACAPFVRDAVIAGLDRDYPAILIFPDVDACRAFCADLKPDASLPELMAYPGLRQAIRDRLADLAARSTGSSTRVTRAILLDVPASIDLGETTDKGSINQRAVLQHRADLVAALYAEQPDARVIVVK